MSIFEKYPTSSYLALLQEGGRKNPMCDRVYGRIVELFGYLDGLEEPDFMEKIDSHPSGQVWEMMVARILKCSGHQPIRRRTNGPRPDFEVDWNGRRIFIEAICPKKGRDGLPDSVPALNCDGEAHSIPEEGILLRVTAAISDKAERFRSYACGDQRVVQAGDACVIAVSSMDMDWSANSVGPCVGVRATLGYGRPFITCVTGDAEALHEGIETRLKVQKSNGAPVDTAWFLSDASAHISGILYSDARWLSTPFSLFEETCFIHNPKAANPLPADFFETVPQVWTICCSGGIAPCRRAYQLRSVTGDC